MALYQVCNINNITQIILPHFENYLLLIQKQSDLLLFKNIIGLRSKSEYLSKDLIINIINLRVSNNKGLS